MFFIVIAFYGKEGYPIATMILTQLLVKYTIALLDTPVVYLLVYGVRRYTGLKAESTPAAS